MPQKSNIIDYLEERGFLDQKTHENLGELLVNPAALYHGIDPTASCLHLGNFVGIVALMHFQKFGHQPVILLGGATGMIGDPSGKDRERPLLTLEEVQGNVKALKKILDRFIKATFVNNYDWFSQMNVIEYLRDVGKQFRVGQMLGKESVRTRLQSEEGMSYTEFSYQMLQGYDFYHLYKHHDVVLQIGGSDQFGNITAGIDYVRRVAGKSVYGVTYPLLTRSDGKKFGKSEKGSVWLSEELFSAYEFYQYLYRTPDQDVIRMMKMLTLMEMDEIRAIEKEIPNKPNFAQKRFAEEVTRLVHGEEGVKKALKTTEIITPGKMEIHEENLKEISANMPNIQLPRNEVVNQSYIDVMVKSGLLSSKGEVRRLIQNQGAYLNGEKVTDLTLVVSEKNLLKGDVLILSSGKKSSLLVQIT